MKPVPKKRFTLIELLVVIAIIAILAAMLLPALNKARGRAQKAKCLGNLKNSNAAMSMYADDYNDFYPVYIYEAATYGVSTHVSWGSWMIRLKYLPRTDVTHCPSAPPYKDNEGDNNFQLFTYGTYGISTTSGIGNLKGVVNLSTGGNTYRGLKGNQVARASDTILLMDSLYKGQHASYAKCNNWQYYSTNIRGFSATATTAYLPQMRHDNSMNGAFLDGHAADMSPQNYAETLKAMFQGVTPLANIQYLDSVFNIRTLSWPSN